MGVCIDHIYVGVFSLKDESAGRVTVYECERRISYIPSSVPYGCLSELSHGQPWLGSHEICGPKLGTLRLTWQVSINFCLRVARLLTGNGEERTDSLSTGLS